MLPPGQSDNAGGWTTEKIATSITLLKSILGTAGPAMLASSQSQGGQKNVDLMQEVQKKISELEKLQADAGSKGTKTKKEKYQYHDDKALFSE